MQGKPGCFWPSRSGPLELSRVVWQRLSNHKIRAGLLEFACLRLSLWEPRERTLQKQLNKTRARHAKLIIVCAGSDRRAPYPHCLEFPFGILLVVPLVIIRCHGPNGKQTDEVRDVLLQNSFLLSTSRSTNLTLAEALAACCAQLPDRSSPHLASSKRIGTNYLAGLRCSDPDARSYSAPDRGPVRPTLQSQLGLRWF